MIFPPFSLQAAPWLAKKLKLALENKDVVMERQIKEEAFGDVGIFAAVAPHLADYGDAGAVALAESVLRLRLEQVAVNLRRNNFRDEGTAAWQQVEREMLQSRDCAAAIYIESNLYLNQRRFRAQRILGTAAGGAAGAGGASHGLGRT
eukprot:Skav202796  [mRNA]  locus=scaffold326:691809:692487:+ [translate_table: standard]